VAIASLVQAEKTRQLDSLLDYAYWRTTLNEAVELLQMDPCWENLSRESTSGTPADFLSLSELSDYECTKSRNMRPEDLAALQQKREEERLTTGGPPGAIITGVHTTDPIPHVETILESFSALAEDGKIEARNFSAKYNHSIYKWEALWKQTRVRLGVVEVNQPWYAYCTIRDVEKLAKYELPDLAEIEQFAEQYQMPLPGFPAQTTFPLGTLLLRICVLLSILYYWVYCQQAQSSRNFPAAGTLFGVFNQSILTKAIFGFLILSPAMASILLESRSFSLFSSLIVFCITGFALDCVRRSIAWQASDL